MTYLQLETTIIVHYRNLSKQIFLHVPEVLNVHMNEIYKKINYN